MIVKRIYNTLAAVQLLVKEYRTLHVTTCKL